MFEDGEEEDAGWWLGLEHSLERPARAGGSFERRRGTEQAVPQLNGK
jgi:hypothetical protein